MRIPSWKNKKEKIKSVLKRAIPYLRTKSVSRISMEKVLFTLLPSIRGEVVLDIGAKHSPYKRAIEPSRVVTLDIVPENYPDICGDVHFLPIAREIFDGVVVSELLEHCYDPQKVIDEIYRVLKKGGVCIASTRFIHHYHPDPKDYFRYTRDSLEILFSKFAHVEIYSHGNRIQALWQIANSGWVKIFLNPFNKIVALIDYEDQKFPLGFVLIARK